MSAAAFARQHSLNYTTLCGWCHRRLQNKPSPSFVQVELPPPEIPAELVIALGPAAWMRITYAGQIALAACLFRILHVAAPC